jgi:excisionase family DNA binding protein
MSTSSSIATRKDRLSQGIAHENPNGHNGNPTTIGAGPNRGLLRVEEAAEWLGLGRTKAYELVYRGVLPSVTIGRSRRVPVAALYAFVERLTAEGGWS